MTVQQLVHRAQGTASRAEQPGGLVKEADRVKVIPARVKAEQHQAYEDYRQQGRAQD
jgi:hypothetical protein